MNYSSSIYFGVAALLLTSSSQVLGASPKGVEFEKLSPHAKKELTRYLGTLNKRLSSMSERELFNHFSFQDAKGNRFSFKTTDSPEEWALKDLTQDGVAGTSTEKAYEELSLTRPSKPVLVAVIDSGIDIKHPDLKSKIWTNRAEAAGTPGVDDDQNGYIDDVHGWNFLGNSKGKNLIVTNYEVDREYGRLRKKKADGKLSPEEEKYFAIVKAGHLARRGPMNDRLEYLNTVLTQYTTALDVLRAAGLKEESLEAVMKIESSEPAVVEAKKLAIRYLSEGATTSRIKITIANLEKQISVAYNPDFDPSSVIGDSEKLDEVGYGNPDVITKSAYHGTHVSGIIGAVRKNGFGIDGQADAIKILPVRAVPDGDERDKDVGNAIRYAVDQGARVINMSFGKAFSPHKSYVDAAVKYAAEHDVLLVHAAGNDGKNNDVNDNYPNRRFDSGSTAPNWIEVGASSSSDDENLPAYFSNYGAKGVDLFAPGVEIYSTVPGNEYGMAQGTSMASPEVAGIAALILTQRPDLSAVELRKLILDGVHSFSGKNVKKPKQGTLIDFAELSATGGVVNAFNSLKLLK